MGNIKFYSTYNPSKLFVGSFPDKEVVSEELDYKKTGDTFQILKELKSFESLKIVTTEFKGNFKVKFLIQ